MSKRKRGEVARQKEVTRASRPAHTNQTRTLSKELNKYFPWPFPSVIFLLGGWRTVKTVLTINKRQIKEPNIPRRYVNNRDRCVCVCVHESERRLLSLPLPIFSVSFGLILSKASCENYHPCCADLFSHTERFLLLCLLFFKILFLIATVRLNRNLECQRKTTPHIQR